MPFKLTTRSFRTRVARRIFLLFIICALVPVSVLSGISYWTVYNQLQNQARNYLRQECKSLSISIYERLLLFRSELKSAASVFQAYTASDKTLSIDFSLRELGSNFSGFGIRQGETWHPLAGSIDRPPRPNMLQADWLSDGNALLMLERRNDRIEQFMVLPLPSEGDPPAWIIGKIDTSFIWEAAEARPPETEVIILDRATGFLYGSIPYNPLIGEGTFSLELKPHSGLFDWKDRDRTYAASFRAIHLKPNFFHPDWVVVLSRAKEDIFAPMRSFRITFPVMIVIAVALVFMLSLVLIQKNLTPIEKLRLGTEKIAEEQFGYQVDIASGDEFETLGNAFNDMSNRLKEGRLLLVRSSKLATMGQVSTGLFNELRQPLTGIGGMAQVLLTDDSLSEDLKEKLKRIKEGIIRMEAILSRFGEFAQISGRRMRPLVLPELIDRIQAYTQVQIEKNNIQVSVDHQKGLPMISGNAHSLEQAFANLVINSIHALEVRAGNDRQLSINTYQWGGKVMVDVIDNGCGMPKRVQTRIFDPFFTTKDVDKGTGLGLSIVESIIHNHGATIDLESTVHVGTKFTVSFPVDLPKETINDA